MADLASYIQQGQSQEFSGDPSLGAQGGPPLSEVVTPEQTAGEAPSAVSGQIDPSGIPQPAVQEPTIPDPRDEELRQLHDRLNAQDSALIQLQHRQAMEAAQREEAQILARIQAIPDEDDRMRAFHDYRAQRYEAIIQAKDAQLQAGATREQQAQIQLAKNSVVAIRALQEGLPPEYVPLLRKADSPEEMEQMIQTLRGHQAQQQVQTQDQQRQAVVDSGVYAAGGAQAGFVPPSMPKERSGDLAGLIAATPPRLASS